MPGPPAVPAWVAIVALADVPFTWTSDGCSDSICFSSSGVRKTAVRLTSVGQLVSPSAAAPICSWAWRCASAVSNPHALSPSPLATAFAASTRTWLTASASEAGAWLPPHPARSATANRQRVRPGKGRGVCQPAAVLPLKDNIPTRRPAILTMAIIAACVFVYFFLQHGGIGGPSETSVVKYSAIPYEITHPGKECALVQNSQIACEGQSGVSGTAPSQPNTWLTILFAMFMHGGLLHLGGNMLFLWIFGNNVEDSMGRPRFLAFYLLGGLAATAAQVAINPGSTSPTLGASGAIAAVLGGYALLYPRARVLTLIFIIIFVTVIELPALLVLGVWFLLQLLTAASQPLHGAGGGVAYFAHIGGFVFGLLFIRMFANHVQDDYERSSRIPVY